MRRDANLNEWEMACQDRRPAPAATCPVCGWFSDVLVDGKREWHSPAYVMAFSPDFQLPDSYATLFEGCGDRECFRVYTADRGAADLLRAMTDLSLMFCPRCGRREEHSVPVRCQCGAMMEVPLEPASRPWWPMCAICGHPVERLEMEVLPPDANTYQKAVRNYRVFCHGQSETAVVGLWAAWEIQCKHGRLPTAFVPYVEAKPEPPRCRFSLAYVGRCENEALPGKPMCSKHDALVCRGCGAPATQECPSASSLERLRTRSDRARWTPLPKAASQTSISTMTPRLRRRLRRIAEIARAAWRAFRYRRNIGAPVIREGLDLAARVLRIRRAAVSKPIWRSRLRACWHCDLFDRKHRVCGNTDGTEILEVRGVLHPSGCSCLAGLRTMDPESKCFFETIGAPSQWQSIPLSLDGKTGGMSHRKHDDGPDATRETGSEAGGSSKATG